MKCAFCGKDIQGFEILTKNGKSFCNTNCEIRFFTTPDDRKQRKYEEIKRKAWELILFAGYDNPVGDAHGFISSRTAWDKAEAFYDFAQEKEGK